MDSSVTSLKTSKKRKKHPTENSFKNTPKKKKNSRNSDISREFVKKSLAIKNTKFQASSAATIQNSNKYGKSKESVKVKTAKNCKKNILKKREMAGIKSQSPSQSKNMPRSKKNKKFKKGIGMSVQISPSVSKDSSMSPAIKKVSKVKKGKKNSGKIKSNVEENINSKSSDELSDICISDDNESDEEVLREEIQKSSIFKQIEKLMKKAPHLNLANSGLKSFEDLSDEDVDNFSDCSISEESGDEESDDEDSDKSNDEDSAMESDNQDASSLDSDLEDSDLKNKTASKKENTSGKKQEKKSLFTSKKNTFTENMTESTGFNRTSKDNPQRKNISDKDKKGEMSSNLKNKVQEKLAGAKFRFLNEKLYTETGKEAFKYFQENTEEFEDYHSGYRLQVSKWPMNPVNEIISDIQKLKKNLVIADLGCGEAKIAQTFPGRTIHSFDLVPLNEFVKACDISKIPLPNQSVDVVVFCLSLMGTNLKDYLCEAFRILKVGGILKIAEVESRIEDLGHFINYLKSIGFNLERKNTKHKMFVFLDLKKEKQKCKLGKVPSLSLRPCLYKKR